MTESPAGDVRPASDEWIVAVHVAGMDRAPSGTGVLIDSRRVLTCAHVVCTKGRPVPEVWAAFPMADELERRHVRVREIIVPAPAAQEVHDVAVLVLEDEVPAGIVAPLRDPRGSALLTEPWWSFGFPDGALGNSADGRVGEKIGYGWVRLDTASQYPVLPGFSGAPVWSPGFQAVVGIVGQAESRTGNARALTLWEAGRALPDQKLDELTTWTTKAAGEAAANAWGWSLTGDVEAGRHWRPRARGVSTDAEPGYRFSGRAAALSRIVEWFTSQVAARKALVVTGQPGAGKSAVLGRIVTTADAEIAALLPSHDTAVRAPLGSIACAVHVKGKTALDVAHEIARAASAALPDTPHDLDRHLRDALTEHERHDFNIVIDALDEAISPSHVRQIVRDIVLPLVENCADLGVRVVVGSRRRDDEGDILPTFSRAADVVDLDNPAFFDADDLAAYALVTLQLRGNERPDNPYNDDDVALPLARAVAERARSNFLIAGLTARTHGMHDQSPARPADLAARAVPSVESALHDYLRPLPPVGAISATDLLTALAYAEAPGLTPLLWRTAVTALTGSSPTEQDLVGFARTAAANFLIETNNSASHEGTYRLFHQALNDTLLAARARHRDTTADENALTHAFLALGRELTWANAPAYLLRALPGHALRGGATDVLLAEDTYPLYADLRRLIPAAAYAMTSQGRGRARLLRLTPRAIAAAPEERIAYLSVTEAQEELGSTYTSMQEPAPYRAVWASVAPETVEVALTGHGNVITALAALDLGGKVHLVSTGNDATVRIWDPLTGEEVRQLAGHDEAIYDACVLPLGTHDLLAVASRDRVAVWDPTTGKMVRQLAGDINLIEAMCVITLDGRLHLAAGGYGGTVQIWDPTTGEETHRRFTDHMVQAMCTITLDDRPHLAACGHDGVVQIWDPATGEESHHQVTGDDAIEAMCTITLADRPLLAVAGGDSVRIWDPATGEETHQLTGHSAQVQAVCTITLNDRTYLATASADTTVRLWDPVSGEEAGHLASHAYGVQAACVLVVDDRALLATGGYDNTVRIWDPAARTTERPVNRIAGVRALSLVEEHDLLVSAGEDNTVRILDPGSGAEIRQLAGQGGEPRAMSTFVLDGASRLATADAGRVRIWDPTTGEAVDELVGDDTIEAMCTVTLDGRPHLAVAAAGGIRIRELVIGEETQHLTGHTAQVQAMCALTLDDRPHLATACEISVRVRDLVAGEETQHLTGHTAQVQAICAVTLDSRPLLASGGYDNSVRIWDPATGEALHELTGHTDWIRAVSTFTLDGRMFLATAGDDATVRIWDPRAGLQAAVIPVRHPVTALKQAGELLVVGFATRGIMGLAVTL
ncbi:trypsin-like peptidase domain-containing protein [Streptomyces sp. 142MFCol3.1]|uniref:trypsin-like peptidase domain-containing protein n=1 Tax=Streptomyces sp. 142MFCol3.1 TaxID=1172179 RepID=UPI00040088B4|nr:trypsin-like peptidase domain-containing protein [Streptomyces sp. 142MFCol3.1]